MAKRCRKYTYTYIPGVGRVRKCAPGGLAGFADLGEIGTLGQAAGVKGIFSEVKGTLLAGAVAVGGAALTDQVFKRIEKSLGVTDPLKINLAMALTGIALGILVGKLVKKPRLGAMLAIGPVTLAGYRLFQHYFPTMAVAPTAGVYALTPYTPVRYPLGDVTIGKYGQANFPYAAEPAFSGTIY